MESDEEYASSNSSLGCKINKEFTFHYLAIVYLIVFLVGLIANGYGLWNLFMNRRKWTSLNVFVLNLGVADLLYVITLPFFVSYYLNKEVWMFGYEFCRVTRCLFHVNMYASISFLTCISVQRYLGIVHPMKMLGRFQNLRHSVLISALVWIWVFIQVLPNLFIPNSDVRRNHCHDSTSNEEENLLRYTFYTLALTITGFLIPFVVIVICYARVLSVLRRDKNIETSALKRRSIKLVAIVLLLCFICFFPFYILRNINLLSRIIQLKGKCMPALKDLYIAYQVTRGLASMNSAINPLIYFVTNENFVSRFNTIRRKTLHAFVFLGRNRDFSLSVSSAGKEESEF